MDDDEDDAEPETFDPKWSKQTFESIQLLPLRPANWQSEPLWSHWGAEIRLRAFNADADSHHIFARGYIQIAEAAIHHLRSHREDRGNYMVFPLLGVLRHAMEVCMKDILHRAQVLAYPIGNLNPKDITTSHNLGNLATAVRNMVVAQSPHDSVSLAWGKLVDYLEWWQVHDPRNALGRYPSDKEGRPLLGSGTTDIADAVKIARLVFSAWNFTYPWLDAMLDFKREADAERRANADYY